MSQGMRFKHFKGGEYEFVCLAFHDTGCKAEAPVGGYPQAEAVLEALVVYRALTDGTTWVRPAEEFFGVLPGSGMQPRFSPLPPPRVKE